ncbi:hypothetical protein HOS13_gp42 [Caulobacter phage Lullwater]|uniref:Uncharacterized protein n=1 Tax=Caulobacter phage Lullwater TaxID=2024607 RepID=A0A291LC41_9CAUD|nr:hypothetical protein HOS13_gp42 [Caulobacter phage Lullwater]ATI16349.1 hypothetical protein Lull_042 [Caulobacter phage Lullwater]
MSVAPPFSHELMGDKEIQTKKIGDFADRRGSHLGELTKLEKIVRELAPLPVSYDVSRTQAPHFSEFTYTEFLGDGVLIQAQSSEASARQVALALDEEVEVEYFPKPRDKYTLNPLDKAPKAVAFLPGTNLLKAEFISREALARAMFEDQELVIKPHPLTEAEQVKSFAREFGYHRVLSNEVSGVQALMGAERVYCSSSTELGLYAVEMKKPILNIGSFYAEHDGTYAAIYRLLWGQTKLEARDRLLRILNSVNGGFVHLGDQDPRSKVEAYFTNAMSIREQLRPLVPVRKK